MATKVRIGRSRPAGEAGDEAAGAVERLATLLEAGVAPESAWAYLGEFSSHPVIAAIAAGGARGERPAEALDRSVAGRGAVNDAWRSLAAAWIVADACGTPLAPTLRELATALRAGAETERDVDVALTGPVATSRLVTWLPAVGLALGMLMGVDVVAALFGSLLGAGALAAGVVLMLCGRAWTRSMVARATPRRASPGLRLDLTAVALSGGVSVSRATAIVDESLARFGLRGGASAELGRILALADRAGAPAVDLLRSAARQERREARTSGQRAAAALAVRLMLPLGICVLPAFMLLGVAPVVLSIVSSTVGSL
ncbi:type II secretion system F family protein [Leifsonia sp. NPDC058292]|uniref:type II secretion system F family protein n=1 Tax=Leifsonia sp. NPDC058292 TaxID=3346428 RepID=UPI0036D9D771